MIDGNPIFNEFRAYWYLSEKILANATKEEVAEVARILALQAAHFARKYGELQLPDLSKLLSATSLDEDSIGFLRDGTEALVGVLATVVGGLGEEGEKPMQ
jgi:hypothetical protein